MKLLEQSAKTNWKFIGIVAFVAVFLAGGILMLIPQFKEQPPPLPQPNNSQVDTSGLPSNSVEGWQTYRNDEFGFELKYPHDWELLGSGTTRVFLSPSGPAREALFMQFERKSINLDDFISEYNQQGSDFQIVSREAIEFAGETATKLSGTSITGVNHQFVFVPFNNWGFIIEYQDIDETQLQILSTFRFVQEGDTGGTRKVKLFYYNKNYDPKFDCLSEAVLSVEREIPDTKTLIQDTIKLLIEGKRTEKEKADGFTSEFPHPEFKLLGANLKEGVLTLDFPVVPSFTTGGSCRIGLLRAQVEKTAKQFFEVKEVRYTNEEIFQP